VVPGPRLQCVAGMVNTSDKRAARSLQSSRLDWVSPQELPLVAVVEVAEASRTAAVMCSGMVQMEESSSLTLCPVVLVARRLAQRAGRTENHSVSRGSRQEQEEGEVLPQGLGLVVTEEPEVSTEAAAVVERGLPTARTLVLVVMGRTAAW